LILLEDELKDLVYAKLLVVVVPALHVEPGAAVHLMVLLVRLLGVLAHVKVNDPGLLEVLSNIDISLLDDELNRDGPLLVVWALVLCKCQRYLASFF
jgi:hypothetical protein